MYRNVRVSVLMREHGGYFGGPGVGRIREMPLGQISTYRDFRNLYLMVSSSRYPGSHAFGVGPQSKHVPISDFHYGAAKFYRRPHVRSGASILDDSDYRIASGGVF